MSKLKFAILLFDEVEVLDFAGPFEVFSVTSQLSDYQILEVITVSKEQKVIRAKNGLKVVPDISIEALNQVDILLIPGGDGSKAVIQDKDLMAWIGAISQKAQHVLTVCSGARILAKLGHLAHQKFTTHHGVFESILSLEPTAIPDHSARFVDNGKFMTSAGVAAGIDLSLYVVEKYFGEAVRRKTAKYMEYGDF
ncbi:DJ-1/PfpI family protein [Cecembia sp.]|uniref:DJ-1/PfpI family protein n=1 Tax=Cecembia sp. TaxID=1898110 RepID=UPI0025BF9C31|nr:DJ-1/PfpI family protein [Cecembia sp.]